MAMLSIVAMIVRNFIIARGGSWQQGNSGDHAHPRFFEGWVLLLTLDTRQFSENELIKLIQLIIHALATPSIHSQMVFRTKCIEIFVNIASALKDTKHTSVIHECFNALAVFLVKIGASIEHLALFWDAKVSIEQRLGMRLSQTPEPEAAMQKYTDLLRKKFGSQSSQFMALGNRIAAMALRPEKKI